MPSLIQFSKIQTSVSIKYLIYTIAELAEVEELHYLIDRLSIVLSVMYKCYEAAPDIPNLPVEMAGKRE